MPQIICRISDKKFFVEWQEFALSAKIFLNPRYLRQKNTGYKYYFYFLRSLRLCASAPLR
jgi:hypothetical protein